MTGEVTNQLPPGSNQNQDQEQGPTRAGKGSAIVDSETADSEAPASARQAQRTARTRGLLVDAALDLFAERGYDSTTVEEISVRAGVSPRTFFRYFPTKETVLFFGRDDFFQSFAELLMAQPRSLNDVDAMLASFIALVPAVQRIRRRVALYQQALASSALLRGRDAELRSDQIAKMATAIKQRGSDEVQAELLATIGDLVMARALDRWLQEPETAMGGYPLAELLTEEVAMLRALFEPKPAGRPDQPANRSDRRH